MEVLAAGVLALGRVGEVEPVVAAALQAFGLEAGEHDLTGRARVGRRLQHDELARAQGPGDVVGGLLDVTEVRLQVFSERRRDATDQDVGLAHSAEVGGGVEPGALVQAGDQLRAQVLEIALALLEGVDLVGIDVKAQGREAGAVERGEQRQTDVTQTDDADDCLVVFDLGFQAHEGHSAVTLFARLRGLSTLHPRVTAAWYASNWSGTTLSSGWSGSSAWGMYTTWSLWR